MEMLVCSRVDSSQTWTGQITEIKDQADSNSDEDSYYYYYSSDSGSSNYTFYVELDNSDGLMLGQHVYMEENAGQNEQKDGLWLEEYYIMEENDHSYVWLANESNLIEKREVTLGEYDEELCKYEILDGLTQEDYIAYPLETISEGNPVIYNDFSSTSSGIDSMPDVFSDADYSDTAFDEFDDVDFDDEAYDDDDYEDDDDYDDYDDDYEEDDDEDYDDEEDYDR
jgi:HlyD family secretion protein